MELKETLKSRRSYRHEFSDRKVSKEELKYIMEAAAGVLAFISRGLVNLSGISYISPSVLALILGIILNNFRKKGDILENGFQFSAKKY